MPQRPLARSALLTQIGFRRGFARRLREEMGEKAMSLLRKRMTVEDAVCQAFRRGSTETDAVRHTSVGRLEDAGLRVIWDGRGHPNHVSVESQGLWDDDVAEKFDRCFED